MPRGSRSEPSGWSGPCPETKARPGHSRTHGKGSTRPGGCFIGSGSSRPSEARRLSMRIASSCRAWSLTRRRARPLAWPADVVQVVGFDDRPAAPRLFGQLANQVIEGLRRADVPAVVPPSAPGVTDVAALEPPFQPAQLDVPQVPEQLDRRPAGRQPAAAQLAIGQLAQLGRQPVPEVVKVAKEHFGAGSGRGGRLGKRDSHKSEAYVRDNGFHGYAPAGSLRRPRSTLTRQGTRRC